ncbi:ABC transporter ATP-binding protein [Gracilibacillus marinus]|uniref:ABC transporter ATP-binding protein n=1 Tax=Gracilibacillus marinus TaxID=630535 RepID=A0ABV8VQT1_9BACI
MLTLSDISYKYRSNQIVFEHVSFAIDQGEIVGLIGRSGVGKTTLAKIIAGYLRPIAGHLSITQEKGKAHPVQLIWQHPEEAVNPKWRIKRILTEVGPINEDLLALFQIDRAWLERFPNQLSGGQLQRICIVRALMTNPSYIIADEMTTMLDPITQVTIWKAFLSYVRSRNIGVLIISHDQALLGHVATRIVTFEKLL